MGGFGITYKAEHRALGREVALKEYLPNEFAVREETTVHPKSEADRADFDWGLRRFLDEARTLAQFEHRNVVRVLDYFEANSTAYIAMEYEDGQSLDELLAGGGTLDEAQMRRVILPIVDGLKQVHAAGILHRDIKPSNIFVRRSDESPVLLDFGAARQALGGRSKSLTAIASAGYSPPEQYESAGGQGPWTDVYALCATCYRAITGEAPVDAPSRIGRIARGAQDPLPGLSTADAARGYSDAFLRAVERGLRVIDAERPRSLDEFEDAIEGGGAPEADAPSEPAPKPARGPEGARRRRTTAWLAGGGLVAVLGALAVQRGSDIVEGVERLFGPGEATLSVATDPPGAEVLVDGEFIRNTPLEVGIPAGTVDVTLEHPLHETVRLRNQRLEDGGTLRIERTLVRATGALRITTSPPGAWVERDGERLADATPATLRDLPAGPVTLTMGAPEHRSAQVRTQVPKDAVGTLEHALEPVRHGTLTLELEPSDTQVTLPDVAPRYEPGMRLPEGTYRVIVERAGYRQQERTLSVSGDTRERIELTVNPQPFTVVTTPPEATVRLLNVDETYRDGMMLKPGDYRVDVSAPAYQTRGRTVRHGHEPTHHIVSLRISARAVRYCWLQAATADDLRSCLPDADLRQRYRQDWSSLLHAMVANGTPTPVIRVFLSAGGDASAEADGGATPLQVAAGRGRNQVVELLLEYGANVDARDDEGMTPLHHAAAMAHNETIAELLEGGANPDVCGTKGQTPLMFAVIGENPGAVRLLLRDGDPEMPCDSDDVPPLHAAVIGGNLDVVNALLEAGAYANVCSGFLSPLDIPMSPELASALVAAGGFAGSCL